MVWFQGLTGLLNLTDSPPAEEPAYHACTCMGQRHPWQVVRHRRRRQRRHNSHDDHHHQMNVCITERLEAIETHHKCFRRLIDLPALNTSNDDHYRTFKYSLLRDVSHHHRPRNTSTLDRGQQGPAQEVENHLPNTLLLLREHLLSARSTRPSPYSERHPRTTHSSISDTNNYRRLWTKNSVLDKGQSVNLSRRNAGRALSTTLTR